MHKRHSLTTAIAAGIIVLAGGPPASAAVDDRNTQAWQEYRAGERASVTRPMGHMGLSLQAWQEYRAGERDA